MATKIYYNEETTKVFAASGGDKVLTLTSLSAGAGRVSEILDRGSGALSPFLKWRLRYKAASNPTVGDVVRLYLLTSDDGTIEDGSFTSGDGAVSSEDLLRNGWLIGIVTADAASTSKIFTKNGIFPCRSRYVRFAVWNALGVALSSTAADMQLDITPVPDESQ